MPLCILFRFLLFLAPESAPIGIFLFYLLDAFRRFGLMRRFPPWSADAAIWFSTWLSIVGDMADFGNPESFTSSDVFGRVRTGDPLRLHDSAILSTWSLFAVVAVVVLGATQDASPLSQRL